MLSAVFSVMLTQIASFVDGLKADDDVPSQLQKHDAIFMLPIFVMVMYTLYSVVVTVSTHKLIGILYYFPQYLLD